MKKYLMLGIAVLLVLSLSACKDKKPQEDPYTDDGIVITEDGEVVLSPEGLAWRNSILNSPKVAEIEHKGTTYEVYVSDSIKYIYNTSTSEIITGTAAGDAINTVLKDWIAPYGKELLNPDEALFETTWEYTSTRIRALIGYCDATYTLVTRARTADYLEYYYEDKANNTMYRIAVTDDYILFAPLVFEYVFDVTAY